MRRATGPGQHPTERALEVAIAALDCVGDGCGGSECHRCQARRLLEVELRPFLVSDTKAGAGE